MAGSPPPVIGTPAKYTAASWGEVPRIDKVARESSGPWRRT